MELDYFGKAMKVIVKQVLMTRIDFSIYPEGGPTADDTAEHIARALQENKYVQSSDIGSPAERWPDPA